jgi:hypothetical protein
LVPAAKFRSEVTEVLQVISFVHLMYVWRPRLLISTPSAGQVIAICAGSNTAHEVLDSSMTLLILKVLSEPIILNASETSSL